MITYIYKITNPNGKVYIGQSSHIKERIARYKSLNCKGQPKIYNSINKYGWNNHSFEIVEEIISNNNVVINLSEINWIKKYDSFYNGLNCNEGGGTMRGYKHSAETINKMKISQKGRIITEEHKSNLSNSLKGKKSWNEGVETTNEIKENISKAHKGKKLTTEHKKKIGNSVKSSIIFIENNHKAHKGKIPWNKGKPFDKTECPMCNRLVSITTAKRWHFANCGKIISEDIHNRLSEAHKGKKGTNNVKILIDEVIYNSYKEASEILKIHIQTIRSRCKSPNFTTYIIIG